VALVTTASPVSAPPLFPSARTDARDAAQAPATSTPAVAASDTPKAPQPSAPIGFSLHYDQDLKRMILEARDPISGFVIYQMPPKYVLRQFSAASSAGAPTRGARVNSAV